MPRVIIASGFLEPATDNSATAVGAIEAAMHSYVHRWTIHLGHHFLPPPRNLYWSLEVEVWSFLMYNRWHIIKHIFVVAEGHIVIARNLRHLAMVLQRCTVLLVRVGRWEILKVIEIEYFTSSQFLDISGVANSATAVGHAVGQRGTIVNSNIASAKREESKPLRIQSGRDLGDKGM
jgi:hypothetical protein